MGHDHDGEEVISSEIESAPGWRGLDQTNLIVHYKQLGVDALSADGQADLSRYCRCRQ
jgi:hypothetical protein